MNTQEKWAHNIGNDGGVVYLDDIGTIAHIPMDLIGWEKRTSLIATTPELFRELQRAESIIEAFWANSAARSEYGWDKSDDDALETIRAALAKATGETE